METWKDVIGYEKYYQVSDKGRVRGKERVVRHSGTFKRVQKGKIIKLHTNGRDGYVYVGLHKHGKATTHKVHRLVAAAFIPNPENKPEVNHMDENKENNAAANLGWVTKLENEHWGTKIQRGAANRDYAEISRKQAKRTIQKDTCGNVVRVWDSLSQACKAMGYSAGNISMACNGKYTKPLYGSYWAYEQAI